MLKSYKKAYNTYGEPKLEIILECCEEELYDAEIDAIEIYDSYYNGFNSTKGGEDGSWGGLKGTSNPGSIYTEDQLIESLKLLQDTKNTNKIISEITGVSTHVIINLSCGRGHKWLKDACPAEYEVVMSLKGNRYSVGAMGIEYPPVISPEGTIYNNITNVTEFSKLHSLEATHMCKLLKGKSKSHRGWTVYKQ